MKKTKSVKARAKTKDKTGEGDKYGKDDVEKYLAKVPEPARSTLQKVRGMIRAVAHLVEIVEEKS